MEVEEDKKRAVLMEFMSFNGHLLLLLTLSTHFSLYADPTQEEAQVDEMTSLQRGKSCSSSCSSSCVSPCVADGGRERDAEKEKRRERWAEYGDRKHAYPLFPFFPLFRCVTKARI